MSGRSVITTSSRSAVSSVPANKRLERTGRAAALLHAGGGGRHLREGSAAALTPDAQIVTLRRGQRGWAEHLHKGRRDEVALATRRASGLGASRGVLAAEGAHVVMRRRSSGSPERSR